MNKYEKALNVINQNLQLAIHDDDLLNPEYSKEQVSALTVAAESIGKRIPKNGIMIGDEYSSVLSCPNCCKPISNVWNVDKYEPNYCHYCGQALDWSDTE